MTSGAARAGKIFIDYLTITHRTKAREMAAVDDFHPQRSQLLER